MALDRESTFASAERLIRQGRVPQALDEFKRLAEDAPRDVLMLNRIGDFLARVGRTGEAIGYYERVADQFTGSGFYPRATAILKKVIKLDPKRTDVLIRLGDLAARQKHTGEARQFLLAAADALGRAGQYGAAREVCERLAAADPQEPSHRVRLAEARAAEGDRVRAGDEMLAAASMLMASGRPADAERVYRRAMELLPERVEPLSGLASSLAALGRQDDAIRVIDEANARRPGDPEILGAQLVLCEELGRADRSALLLLSPSADHLRDEAFERVFALALSRGSDHALWERVVPLLARWTETGRRERSAELLDRLVRIDVRGYVPALEALVELRREQGARTALARALERAILGHRAHGQPERAAPYEAELRSIDPDSPLLPRSVEAKPVARAAPEPLPAAEDSGGLPLHWTAPAVPLSSADEEFVSGHMTEAEVFQKYGLSNEAHQQLRDVTHRFPGHVGAQERLVALLRSRPQSHELRDALAALALARRASGDLEGARRDAAEAERIMALEPRLRAALAAFGLLAPIEGGPEREGPRAGPEAEEELEITFDGGLDLEAAPVERPPLGPASPAVPPSVRRRVPSRDMIEEITQSLATGDRAEAMRKIDALRTLGFGGPELDEVEAGAKDESAGHGTLDDDALSSIAEALDAEYGVRDEDAPAAVAEAEPDLGAALHEFRKRVEEEVGREDYRTHYDLGIAYKEMGLIDEALAEFESAARSPELFRDACAMTALCHRERGERAEAVRWYRQALAAPGAEDAPLSGVRYDLAEVLAEAGDYRGALDLFLEVMNADPSYRDVRRHVTDLRSRLGS